MNILCVFMLHSSSLVFSAPTTEAVTFFLGGAVVQTLALRPRVPPWWWRYSTQSGLTPIFTAGESVTGWKKELKGQTLFVQGLQVLSKFSLSFFSRWPPRVVAGQAGGSSTRDVLICAACERAATPPQRMCSGTLALLTYFIWRYWGEKKTPSVVSIFLK